MFLAYKAVNYAVEILKILLLLRVLLSWISPNSNNEFVALVYQITEPILRPFRLLIPMGRMGIDLSPLIAYYALGLIRMLIFRVLNMLF